MDPTRFDVLTQTLATTGSRRRLLGSVLGSALAGVTGTAEAAKKRTSVTTERCLAIGERCPKTIKHGKKQVKHTCEGRCCTRFAVVSTDGKRRCACREGGQSCTAATARHCCSGVCDGSVCVPVTAGPVGPQGSIGPPGPTGPQPPPPPVCPAVCPTCQTCSAATDRVCAVDARDNGAPGTNCAAPNACCSGTCCTSRPEGVRECNAGGMCATCAEVCPTTGPTGGCTACANLANGETRCTRDVTPLCDRPCTPHSVCPTDAPFCVESITLRDDNQIFPILCLPAAPGTGFCTSLSGCFD